MSEVNIIEMYFSPDEWRMVKYLTEVKLTVIKQGLQN